MKVSFLLAIFTSFFCLAQIDGSILQTRSAIFWAEEMESPVLILNGQADPQVVPMHALNMAAELSGLGKEYELIIMEGAIIYYPERIQNAGIRKY